MDNHRRQERPVGMVAEPGESGPQHVGERRGAGSAPALDLGISPEVRERGGEVVIPTADARQELHREAQ